MLKTIKSLVDKESVPFAVYYMDYIMRVQDQNIDREVKSMLRRCKSNVSAMSVLIENTYKSIKKG